MPDHFYVYPTYLRRSSRRADGRRVPASEAVGGEVTGEAMLGAAKALGYQAELETKHYPKEAWKVEGRLKVTKRKGVTKAKFLVALARELRKQTPTPVARSGE